MIHKFYHSIDCDTIHVLPTVGIVIWNSWGWSNVLLENWNGVGYLEYIIGKKRQVILKCIKTKTS